MNRYTYEFNKAELPKKANSGELLAEIKSRLIERFGEEAGVGSVISRDKEGSLIKITVSTDRQTSAEADRAAIAEVLAAHKPEKSDMEVREERKAEALQQEQFQAGLRAWCLDIERRLAELENAKLVVK